MSSSRSLFIVLMIFVYLSFYWDQYDLSLSVLHSFSFSQKFVSVCAHTSKKKRTSKNGCYGARTKKRTTWSSRCLRKKKTIDFLSFLIKKKIQNDKLYLRTNRCQSKSCRLKTNVRGLVVCCCFSLHLIKYQKKKESRQKEENLRENDQIDMWIGIRYKRKQKKCFILSKVAVACTFFFHIFTNKNNVMENIRLLFNDWFRQTTNNSKQKQINVMCVVFFTELSSRRDERGR